ncbi:hypothetical protein Tco_1346460 [Tanacetum coccineum]
MSNQTNELKNMMASFFQMNTPSTSGSRSLPSNTVANPRGELKAITTRSGLVLDGPSFPMPLPFINPVGDERRQRRRLLQTELAGGQSTDYRCGDGHGPTVQGQCAWGGAELPVRYGGIGWV